MRIMKEMVEVVNKSPQLMDEFGHSVDKQDMLPAATQEPTLANGMESNNTSNTCQNPGLILLDPDYLSLVREQKESNYYTKEQLLSAVQVSCLLSSSYYYSFLC